MMDVEQEYDIDGNLKPYNMRKRKKGELVIWWYFLITILMGILIYF